MPAQVTRRDAAGEQLEVGVPDPRDVAAVGDLVVEHGEQVVLAGLERQRAQDLVGAGRVLDQQDAELVLAERDGLGAAERGGDPLKPGDDRRERDPERDGEGGGGERVVDVVEAGEGQRDAGGAGRRAQLEGGRRGRRRA